MNAGECGDSQVSTRTMDQTDPDASTIKSEPRSPTQSGVEEGGETFFFDVNLKTENSVSSGHTIKVEIFPDLPIEFEPRTEAEEGLQNCTEFDIKEENGTYCSEKGENLSIAEYSLSTTKSYQEEKIDDAKFNIDIDSDIEQNCFEYSRKVKQHRVGLKKTDAGDEILIGENSRKNLLNKPFSCGQCPYKCNRRGNLRKHLLTHTEDRPFVCPQCPYACNLKEYLKRHMLTHSGNKLFSCPHCVYSCYRKEHLRRHLLTHTRAKPFCCQYCDFSCNQKALLRTHITTHTGDKSFSCTRCNYTGVSKGSLKSHGLIHSGDKAFVCPHCPYSCKRRGHLRRHMLTHIGSNSFTCPHCKYACKRKGDLSRHLLTHSGEKPFSCSRCSYKCNQRGNLRSHMLTHAESQVISEHVSEQRSNF